jgi:hypothetical protein
MAEQGKARDLVQHLGELRLHAGSGARSEYDASFTHAGALLFSGRIFSGQSPVVIVTIELSQKKLQGPAASINAAFDMAFR